jgi:predicted nucleic acid-binding protein
MDLMRLLKAGKASPSALVLLPYQSCYTAFTGLILKKRRLTRSAFVEKIIQTFPLYPFDLGAARIYAKLWSNLAKKGIANRAHDLMITSTAIALGFSVVTSELRDYGKVKELTVEKFTL